MAKLVNRPPTDRTITVTLTITPADHATIAAVAKDEERSVGALVRFAIREYIARKERKET